MQAESAVSRQVGEKVVFKSSVGRNPLDGQEAKIISKSLGGAKGPDDFSFRIQFAGGMIIWAGSEELTSPSQN